MTRLQRSHRLARQDGVTLVELLVALLVSAFVLSGMTAIALGTYRVSQRVDVTVADGLQAQTAISVMTRDVRAAAPVRPSDNPAFHHTGPFEVRFTANLQEVDFDDHRPALVTIRLEDDGRVVEEVAGPLPPEDFPGWDTDNAQVRYITSFVVNEDDQPMLRYFDRDGVELVPDESESNGLTWEQRRAIAQVELTLIVSGDPNEQLRRYAVESRIRIPNADRQATNPGDD